MEESKKSAVPPYEQETTISFSRDNNDVDVWTSDTTMMTKLDRLCENSPNEYRCIEVGKSLDGLLANKRYTIKNKKLVSFRSATTKREISDEQRKALAQRMRDLNKSKSTNNNTGENN